MRTIIATATIVCLVGMPVSASPERQAEALVVAWANAHSERDYKKTTALYSPEARLRPGDSVTWVGLQSIAEFYYFDAVRFQSREIAFREHDCRVYDDATAQCTGLFEVRQTTPEGQVQKQFTRFGIGLVTGDDGQWMIDSHQQVPVTPIN